jgi:RNA polymerase sigma-70 factor, ECF subfamily
MPDDRKTNDFVALYASGQRRIYAFVRSQVLSAADADDVLQDTAAILWRKFDQFQPGTDFVRWACRVARLEVLAHHRHRKRLLSLFSEEVADAVAEQVLELGESADARAAALDDCVDLLPERDRQLLDLKYQSAQTVKHIALALHRTESTVYKSLERIHDNLYDCIEAKLEPKTKP